MCQNHNIREHCSAALLTRLLRISSSLLLTITPTSLSHSIISFSFVPPCHSLHVCPLESHVSLFPWTPLHCCYNIYSYALIPPSLPLSLLSSFCSLACICHSFHYIKRLIETIFVHRFSHGTMPLRTIARVGTARSQSTHELLCGSGFKQSGHSRTSQ